MSGDQKEDDVKITKRKEKKRGLLQDWFEISVKEGLEVVIHCATAVNHKCNLRLQKKRLKG